MSVENNGRTLVMGDIHGGHKALRQCLIRSEFDRKNDTLIQLGDVADGWSETYECVEELLSIPNLIALRGNHDFWTLQWMASGYAEETHRGQGGQATINSYRNSAFHTPDSHLSFFRYQHDYYVDDQNRLFVHGGINRFYPIREGNNTHNYSWNRTMWKMAMSIADSGMELDFADNFTEVFIGHTTTLNWGTDKPMHRCQVWNLDTGAGFQGRLTIMDVNTKEYWQSDLVETLYPEEHGRRKIEKLEQ